METGLETLQRKKGKNYVIYYPVSVPLVYFWFCKNRPKLDFLALKL